MMAKATADEVRRLLEAHRVTYMQVSKLTMLSARTISRYCNQGCRRVMYDAIATQLRGKPV